MKNDGCIPTLIQRVALLESELEFISLQLKETVKVLGMVSQLQNKLLDKMVSLEKPRINWN